ncbi:hypothetical protein PCE1_002511 [Barthelona sp. PCE]
MEPEERNAVMEGPQKSLLEAVEEGQYVLVNCRNNRQIYGILRFFDNHFDLIIEEALEIWTSEGPGGVLMPRQRKLGNMMVRGDSVISIVPNPPS